MVQVVSKLKVEYGDFQTPLELAEKICIKLLELGVSPEIIIEPTCGTGNFIQASAHAFKSASKIIGVEINPNYLQQIKQNKQLLQDDRIQVRQGDFFEFDYSSLIQITKTCQQLLILGNFPWVTNAKLSVIGGENLPQKTNFQNHTGLDAITGKSNFDISEWMLINALRWLQKREGYLGMLCKTSVARKLLNYIQSQNLNLAYCATYKIDTKKYFNATVDACLVFCKFDLHSQNYFCDVFASLNTNTHYRMGYRNNIPVRDIASFDKLQDLHNLKGEKWRSGIKHDCSSIMELRKVDDRFINGLGEVVEIEDTYLFPLVKGSDVAQNRTAIVNRYALVTQRFVGEPTEQIQKLAPKTWDYLEAHSKYLDNRKSKIYQKSSRFSIFGVGAYTFAPWKIAICGLYKKLDFRLVGQINSKAVVFDDTVYFLSFEDEKDTYRTLTLLTSPQARDFYSCLIFWDEKRPIKSSILNSLNLAALAKRFSLI
jgi:hypothetical protein